jgi:pyruvate-formate lyase-activating enzyme
MTAMRRVIQSAALLTYRHFSHLIPRGVRNQVYRMLYPPGTQKPIVMYIDVVGCCNLRCPSCPAGNMPASARLSPIRPELFARIIQKAKEEYGVFFVSLYNWTEPLLHPQLPELIRIVKRAGLHCGLSSNLNVLRDVDSILDAGPDDFRVSVSGFTQAVYGQTHLHGDIEKVKRNMRLLSEAKRKLANNKTVLYVYYHKYRHNLQEMYLMREYSRSLGFDWLENWAYYMPLERVLGFLDGTISAEQRQFVEGQFALPIGKALEAAKALKDEPCSLLQDQLIVDAAGNINLCCAVYDTAANRLGSFLDLTPDALSRAKSRHPTCARCSSLGLHAYFTYHENPALRKRFEALALASLNDPRAPLNPPVTLEPGPGSPWREAEPAPCASETCHAA